MRYIKTARQFLRAEITRLRNGDVSVRSALRYYWHGFRSDAGELYDFDKYDIDAYVATTERRRIATVNEPNGVLLDNKLAFHYLLTHSYSDLLPDLYSGINNGQLVRLPSIDPPASSLETLIDDWLTEQGCIIKPINDMHGADIVSIARDSDGYRLSGQSVDRDTLLDRLRSLDGALVTERVEQADYANAIYPGSANTLRVITAIDPDTGRPFLVGASHRFGTDVSGVVDNWSSGGICCRVDTEAGTLSEAARKSSDGVEFLNEHPVTKAMIAGREIPSWDYIRETVLDLADEYAGLWGYVGWDIIVTDKDGSIKLIEANREPGVQTLQVHKPLLIDSKVRRFYRSHGVI